MKIARHAESDQNRHNPGTLDSGNPDISYEGGLQALQLAEQAATWGLRRIVASPSLRAEKTGLIVASGLGVPLYTDSRLRELDWGTDAGNKVSEVFGNTIDTSGPNKGLDLRPNQYAETNLEAAARFMTAMAEWDDDETLLVSHKFTMQSGVAVSLDWDRSQMLKQFKPLNAEVYDFDLNHPATPERIFAPNPSNQPSLVRQTV